MCMLVRLAPALFTVSPRGNAAPDSGYPGGGLYTVCLLLLVWHKG